MEYNICGNIAQVRLTSLEDLEMNVESSQPVLDSEIQIKIELQEEAFDEIDFGFENIKKISATSRASNIHQMAMVEQKNDVESDVGQQEAGLPFIKEEVSDMENAEGCSKAEPTPVKSAQMMTSFCATDNGSITFIDGLNWDNRNLIFADKFAKPTVHGEKLKLYSCAHCSYNTPKFGNLKNHIRIHSVTKPFSCKFCDYKCSFSKDMNAHVRKHTGELFSCEFCDYKSSRSDNLQTHLRKHLGELFSCEFCDYKSCRPYNLKTHLRKHTGELFSCEFCDYKSSRSDNLQTHLRKHLGELFSCEFCDYKSCRPYNLKTHLRKHTGELFSCEFCDYISSRSDNLKTHLRKHTGEKPFSCDFCDYKSSFSKNLKAHVRKHTG